MPEIKDPEWLNADDIKDGDEIEFFDEGAYKEITVDDKKKEIFEIGILIPSGKFKIWTMNARSRRAVRKLFGGNTAEWVKKKVKLIKVKKDVFGQIKDVVYVQDEK